MSPPGCWPVRGLHPGPSQDQSGLLQGVCAPSPPGGAGAAGRWAPPPPAPLQLPASHASPLREGRQGHRLQMLSTSGAVTSSPGSCQADLWLPAKNGIYDASCVRATRSPRPWWDPLRDLSQFGGEQPPCPGASGRRAAERRRGTACVGCRRPASCRALGLRVTLVGGRGAQWPGLLEGDWAHLRVPDSAVHTLSE